MVDALLALPWNAPLTARFGPRRAAIPAYAPFPAP